MAINDRKDDNWGTEVVQPLIVMQQDSAVKVFNPGLTAQILIESEAAHLKVSEHEIVLIIEFSRLKFSKTVSVPYSLCQLCSKTKVS